MKAVKDIFKKLNYVINGKQKRQYVVVTLIAFIGSMWELLGVSAILPFVEAIMSPDELNSKWYTKLLYKFITPKSNMETITILGIFIIIVYILKNLYLMFSQYVQAWYSTGVQRDLSIKLANTYLHSSYLFHLGVNSSVLIRSVTQDIPCRYPWFMYAYPFLWT